MHIKKKKRKQWKGSIEKKNRRKNVTSKSMKALKAGAELESRIKQQKISIYGWWGNAAESCKRVSLQAVTQQSAFQWKKKKGTSLRWV